MWPHRRLPLLIERARSVDVTMYSVRVLSGWDSRRYGCEYDSEVGLLYPGVAAENDGDGDAVLVGEEDAGNEAENLLGSVSEVARRESRRLPSGDNHIS